MPVYNLFLIFQLGHEYKFESNLNCCVLVNPLPLVYLLHFPSDVLILSIYRQGNRLDSHGYTRLELGDHVAVVGSPDSLAEVEVRFEG